MNKEYLNERQYEESKEKINKVGTVLLVIGGAMLILGFVMAFAFQKYGMFVFAVIGLALVGFGGQAKLLGHGREIAAFMAQSQMPVAKEGMEKMAPSAGKAAKEIAKGIKEGLKDDE